MGKILICAGDITLEALLSVVIERMGHETEILRSAPRGELSAGDLLVVDPTALHATAWAQALRDLDPAMPVVAVGLDPLDPGSLGFRPNTVMPKPFTLDELRSAVEQTVRT